MAITKYMAALVWQSLKTLRGIHAMLLPAWQVWIFWKFQPNQYYHVSYRQQQKCETKKQAQYVSHNSHFTKTHMKWHVHTLLFSSPSFFNQKRFKSGLTHFLVSITHLSVLSSSACLSCLSQCVSISLFHCEEWVYHWKEEQIPLSCGW